MKSVIKAILVLVVAAGVLFALTGFIKRTDVLLEDFTVSEDGKTITLVTGIASSMGFTRACSQKNVVCDAYVTFYSTFGALNSSIGAKSVFEIAPDEDCTGIFFYSSEGRYKQVLQKSAETGAWERVA